MDLSKKINKLIKANVSEPVKVKYMYSMNNYSVFSIKYIDFFREVNINISGADFKEVEENLLNNIEELIHEIRFTVFLAKSK